MSSVREEAEQKKYLRLDEINQLEFGNITRLVCIHGVKESIDLRQQKRIDLFLDWGCFRSHRRHCRLRGGD